MKQVIFATLISLAFTIQVQAVGLGAVMKYQPAAAERSDQKSTKRLDAPVLFKATSQQKSEEASKILYSIY